MGNRRRVQTTNPRKMAAKKMISKMMEDNGGSIKIRTMAAFNLGERIREGVPSFLVLVLKGASVSLPDSTRRFRRQRRNERNRRARRV